jgi:hypothetical protein
MSRTFIVTSYYYFEIGFTVQGSRFTVHGSRFTVPGFRGSVHGFKFGRQLNVLECGVVCRPGEWT